jgi:rare lipoprotein A
MPNRRGTIAAFASAAVLAACQSLPTPSHNLPPVSQSVPAASTAESHTPAYSQIGLASWYGPHSQGQHTADGERFNMNALTAAHRTLPFNSYVRVTDLATHRAVVVRINDRGPYVGNRIIDLSARAARELGIKHGGVAWVRIVLVNESAANPSDRNSPLWASEYH